jgi:uncharacterized phage protein (TIGR02218 family)
MKSASPELIELLHSSELFYKADLYSFLLSDGTVLRYTNADIDLIVGGNVYKSDELLFERSNVTWSIGLDVDEMDLTVYVNDRDKIGSFTGSDVQMVIRKGESVRIGVSEEQYESIKVHDRDTSGGMPFINALRVGSFDDAILTLEILFMRNWRDTTIPPLTHFVGRVLIEEAAYNYADLKIRSVAELLDVDLPKHILQPACLHMLYKEGCDLNKDTFKIDGAVMTGSTQNIILCDALTQEAGFFDLGFIQFTSGPNTGVKRTIREYTPGSLKLIYPLFDIPSVNDTFLLYPGCDKTKASCTNKFNNLPNYRGYPHVPRSEQVI